MYVCVCVCVCVEDSAGISGEWGWGWGYRYVGMEFQLKIFEGHFINNRIKNSVVGVGKLSKD